MSFVYEKQSLPNITENTEEKAKQLVDIALKSIDHAIKK
jgi:hypothetical protein